MEEEEVDSSPLKRASETDPEEVLMQVQENKLSTKKYSIILVLVWFEKN